MNWHLYRKDDPRTWPEIDCPMLVYINNENYYDFVTIAKWVSWCNEIYDMKSDEYLYVDECYYAFIGYVPNGYKVHSPILCDNEGHNSHLCDEYDNGYCMDRRYHVDCPHKTKWNEYEIETKRVWKEFE